ncbi:MAG: 50S ribosomal protein L35 [Dehalococcoidia bacterium]|nr:50S ribosomal protein L35 [Dehalococcoidia bacterium]
MPKIKTHKGAKARLGISGSGKILRRKGHVNNYRRKKHRRAKGLFDEMMQVHPSMRRKMRRLLPYGR